MLSANFKSKRTAAASRGFLATARLSCFSAGHHLKNGGLVQLLCIRPMCDRLLLSADHFGQLATKVNLAWPSLSWAAK